jgi:hypothetical protein
MTQRIKPTRREGGQHDDYIEEHPAYAIIGASRVSSTPGASLFGSDFRHGHYVTIRIKAASLHRSLSNDWVGSSGKQLIEVALSEAQWATFVSAMNMGDGVPCTLQYLPGEIVPGIEPITDRGEQFSSEVADHLQETLASLEALRDAAPNKKLRSMAEQAIMQLRSNLPFVARQFDEHAEKTVERAKVEVAAYVTQAVHRAGLQALAGESAPILLESGDDA